ncbi:LacI family transcriptional regulator [Reticulibacter mediterranei]|uniref:LacI family transcriptional regulator n=1 Tax=Reticulibacter mediterranei TaxID=2778369 RepID=A0A8J3IGR2_9CHLR|nr:LacI family DNA-binding transcriptional regulator [Reticulibacter mediterranei]GHO90465.1 LacI family transcriptional regulator [Reticulibacter mediterranei]
MPVVSNHHNKKLTIHDIAELAGVSAGTVSRVLNNQPGVSVKTREHIQAIIQQQGYRASFFARSLLARQSFAIGLALSSTASELFAGPIVPELVGSIGDALASEGYTLTLITGSHEQRNQRLLREAAEGKIDGVLLPDIRIGDDIIDKLLEQEIPTVIIGHRDERKEVAWVDCEHDCSAAYLTRMLIKQGHRRIALVNGPEEFYACHLRLEGYRSALQEEGLDYNMDLVSVGPFKADYGYQTTQKLLALPRVEQPTAIVAGSDIIAAGCLGAVKAANMQVPADLAITGFDDNILSTFTHPPLTTVKMPLEQMGKVAVNMLISLIKGEKLEPTSLILPCSIIVRTSSGS